MKKALGTAALLLICAGIGYLAYRYLGPLTVAIDAKFQEWMIWLEVLIMLSPLLGYLLVVALPLGYLTVWLKAGGNKTVSAICALLGGFPLTAYCAVNLWNGGYGGNIPAGIAFTLFWGVGLMGAMFLGTINNRID